MAGVPLER